MKVVHMTCALKSVSSYKKKQQQKKNITIALCEEWTEM